MKNVFSGAVNVTGGPLTKNVVIFSIPIICTSLLQLMFNAADYIVVGRFAGSYSMGAIGATSAMINLLIGFFVNISVGAGVCVAHAYGAGDDSTLHRTVSTAIPLAIIMGVFATAVGLPLAGPFLTLTGTPDDIIGLSRTYLQIYLCGTVFSLVFNFGAAILRSIGNTLAPFCYLAAAGVINVVLNLFFVIVLHMDVAGVALATIISQGVSAVLVMYSLMRRRDACRFSFRQMKVNPDILVKILKIGTPAGAQGSMFSLSNVIIQSSVNSFGAVAVAGNSAAMNIESYIWVIMNAFQQSAMVFMGQNIGAKNYDRARRSTLVCAICVVTAGLVFGGSASVFSHDLLRIFIVDSEEAIRFGAVRVAFVCMPYFILGFSDVMGGSMRGMGVSTAPMIISVFGICVLRIIWIYTVFMIPQYHTPEWLFFSYPLSWAITLAADLVLFHFVKKRRLRPLDSSVKLRSSQ